MGHRTAATLTVLVVLGAAACDGGGDAAESTPATTLDNTTAATATTAAETTTTSSTTTSTSTTTTTTTTTTTSTTTPEQAAEALKAQIAADYERAFYETYDLLSMPMLENLDDRLAGLRAPGTAVYDALRAVIEDLVQTGDRYVPNEPDLLSVTVESVTLEGSPPHTQAIVTACEVINRKRVTPAENSPTGQEIQVIGSGTLLVNRIDQPVQLTPRGWVVSDNPVTATVFEGVTRCPEA